MLGRSSFLSELEPHKTAQHAGSVRCKPTTDSRAFITHAFRTAPFKCRRLDPGLLAASASRNGRAGSPPPPIPPEELGELGERILSGEFTEEGSTREKLTRPVRKLLAKDPIGPGSASQGRLTCHSTVLLMHSFTYQVESNRSSQKMNRSIIQAHYIVSWKLS